MTSHKNGAQTENPVQLRTLTKEERVSQFKAILDATKKQGKQNLEEDWVQKLRDFVENGTPCEGFIKTPKGQIFIRLNAEVGPTPEL